MDRTLISQKTPHTILDITKNLWWTNFDFCGEPHCARMGQHPIISGCVIQEYPPSLTYIITTKEHLKKNKMGWSRKLLNVTLTMRDLENFGKPDASLCSWWPGFWAYFLYHILSQVTCQVTWPRLRTQVTCGVSCLSFLKWLHMSLRLFWDASYCFSSNGLLTSPCISDNTVVTSRNAGPSWPTGSGGLAVDAVGAGDIAHKMY